MRKAIEALFVVGSGTDRHGRILVVMIYEFMNGIAIWKAGMAFVPAFEHL